MLRIGELAAGGEGCHLEAVAAGVAGRYPGADEAPWRRLAGAVRSAWRARWRPSTCQRSSPAVLQTGPARPRAARPTSRPGYDLTFSAPKSVSPPRALGEPRRLAAPRTATSGGGRDPCRPETRLP